MILIMFGLLGLAPAALLYLMPGWKSYWTVIVGTLALFAVALAPMLVPGACPEGTCAGSAFGFLALVVSLPVTVVTMVVVGGIKFVQIKTAMGKRPYEG